MYEFEPGTPTQVIADPARTRQVLLNYLSNAVKFTEHGEVLVNVSSTSIDAEHQRLAISVRDSGIGIAPDQLARLFKPFNQADVSTTRQFGGTGLGLAICKRLAELMDGEVGARSQPGAGSTFSFTFAAGTHGGHPEVEWPGVERLAGRRLLLIDDNATRRRIVRHIALSWGLQVTDGDSSDTMLQVLERDKRFDLAVVNDPDPGMEGSGLAHDLRMRHARHEGIRLPIILLSNVKHAARPATEFDRVLRKPLRQKNLFEAMLQTLVPGALPAADASPSTLLLPTLSVLVVEDHPVNRTITLRLLKTFGLTADAADNGLAAVHAVKRKPYDLVFMDVQLPAIDGLEATRRIRQLPLQRQPLIFAMTAGVLVRERQRCIASGMDHYLAKPIRKQDLAQALREIGGPGPSQPSSLQAPATRADDVIDAQAIRQLVHDLGRNGALEVLQTMVDAAPLACQSMDEACRVGDLGALCRQMARLKANSLMLGCAPLADACADSEKTIPTSTGPGIEEMWHGIAKRYAAVMQQLTPWLEYL